MSAESHEEKTANPSVPVQGQDDRVQSGVVEALKPCPFCGGYVCQTCNGRGEIGGFSHAESSYITEPCPDCAALQQPPSGAVQPSPVGSYDDGVEAAAKVAETRYASWHEGSGVSCDVTACEEIASAIRSLKSTGQGSGDRTFGPRAPEGWKLVPVEPAPGMMGDAERECSGFVDSSDIKNIYAAMLAAAPAPPSQRSEAERSSSLASEGGE